MHGQYLANSIWRASHHSLKFHRHKWDFLRDKLLPYSGGSVYCHGSKIVPLSWDDALEISLECVAEVEDPYHAFIDSIKNKETQKIRYNFLSD